MKHKKLKKAHIITDYDKRKRLYDMRKKKPIKLKANENIKIGAGIWKAGTTIYKCPRCDSFISRSSNYCVNCGQALDWSND